MIYILKLTPIKFIHNFELELGESYFLKYTENKIPLYPYIFVSCRWIMPLRNGAIYLTELMVKPTDE